MRHTAATGQRGYEAPMSPVEAQSAPWRAKPVQAPQLLKRSWASSEPVLFRGLKSASSPESDFANFEACPMMLG
jgi:hypothetical protein